MPDDCVRSTLPYPFAGHRPVHGMTSGRQRLVTWFAALVIVLAASLGTAAGPAHARVPDPDEPKTPPTQTTPPPPPATVPKQKVVIVDHTTPVYSTPYANARKHHTIAPATYVAICEAYSSSPGHNGNRWWSKLRDGYWINNGDLHGRPRGKLGIGTCAAPRNDQGTSGIVFTTGSVTGTIYFNKRWTAGLTSADLVSLMCPALKLIPDAGAVLEVYCHAQSAAIAFQARRAASRHMCVKIKFFLYQPTVAWPDIYKDKRCN